ncbi:hypothetical protein KL938_004787 [Ogataea parapolymorpha]|nr:hypothetical protein KL938_004787 [Ogataea parapolymorpha]
MVLVQDLLHPSAASEAKKHKLKTLVQEPRSFFMDVKCPGCLQITTVFSHAQTAVTCDSCTTVLCTPTGGKAKLSEGLPNGSVVEVCLPDLGLRKPSIKCEIEKGPTIDVGV